MGTVYKLNKPKFELDPDYASTPAPVDASCHVRSVSIAADVDEVDVETWCNPGGTAPGEPTYTVDIDWVVNDDTDDVLAALLGQTVEVILTPDVSSVEELAVVIDFGQVNPAVIGTWEVGGVIESSTSHSAVGAPAWRPVA